MNTIERQIIRQCLADLIEAGYTVSLSDGDSGWLIKHSVDAKAILAEMGSMDEDVLHVVLANPRGSSILFVYGNDTGADVLADYGVSLEVVLRRTNALAMRLAG